MRRRRLLPLVLVVLAAASISGSCGLKTRKTAAPLPDFSRYSDAKERKDAFFSYLLPLIRDANAEIVKERERLLSLREKLAKPAQLRRSEVKWLRRLAASYSLEPSETTALDLRFLDQLAQRVDIIPASLALAQAANESAWGSSRFAREGNNLFGLHSHDGTGLIPRRRDAGAQLRVAAYKSPSESVLVYIKTLNTQPAYRRFRELRAAQHRRGQALSGYSLANGLQSYSERGSDYVSILQSMIQSNHLARFDSN